LALKRAKNGNPVGEVPMYPERKKSSSPSDGVRTARVKAVQKVWVSVGVQRKRALGSGSTPV
jgi:hypothetical protein